MIKIIVILKEKILKLILLMIFEKKYLNKKYLIIHLFIIFKQISFFINFYFIIPIKYNNYYY